MGSLLSKPNAEKITTGSSAVGAAAGAVGAVVAATQAVKEGLKSEGGSRNGKSFKIRHYKKGKSLKNNKNKNKK
jgi:hypothetical protein